MDIKNIEAEIIRCIAIMQIPVNRKQITENNLRWMLRNLGIKNGNHPLFEKVMKYIKLWLSSEEIRKQNCN